MLQSGTFPFVQTPPPPLERRCHYRVNHYVQIWHERLGGANNMHPQGSTIKRKGSTIFTLKLRTWCGTALIARKLDGEQETERIIRKICRRHNLRNKW